MGPADMKLHQIEPGKRITMENLEKQREKGKKEQKIAQKMVALESDTLSETNSSSCDPEVEFSPSSFKVSTKERPRLVMSKDLAGTYDQLSFLLWLSSSLFHNS